MESNPSNSSNPPCAACKFLRRKCQPGCPFSPYFPPEEPSKFADVHKIFGASNVSKLLNEIPPHQREDAVNTLAYEAHARLQDPVYGCVAAISALQNQVLNLQKELDATNADIMRCRNPIVKTIFTSGNYDQQRNDDHNYGIGGNWSVMDHAEVGAAFGDPYSGFFCPNQGSLSWEHSEYDGGEGGGR